LASVRTAPVWSFSCHVPAVEETSKDPNVVDTCVMECGDQVSVSEACS
jgi:hypothetical protein